MMDEWKVEGTDIIHLHTDSEDGIATKIRERNVCGTCKAAVPTLVLKLAEEEVRKKGDGMDPEVAGDKKRNGKKEKTTLTLEEIEAAMAGDPSIGSKIVEMAKKSAGAGTGEVEFEAIPAYMLFFPQGRPDDKTRELLKAKGFTFRPANVNGENRPTWVGPAATLKGTVFEIGNE